MEHGVKKRILEMIAGDIEMINLALTLAISQEYTYQEWKELRWDICMLQSQIVSENRDMWRKFMKKGEELRKIEDYVRTTNYVRTVYKASEGT